MSKLGQDIDDYLERKKKQTQSEVHMRHVIHGFSLRCVAIVGRELEN